MAEGRDMGKTDMTAGVDWDVADRLVDYPDALAAMTGRVAGIADNTASEQIWLLEHPPLYTAGTSANPAELIDPRFPVYDAGRGGRYTYHGPGQRVGYVMLDLRKRGRDIRCFVHALEGWVIATFSEFGVKTWRASGRIGIWTNDGGREAKIGAIGIRIRQWISFHGFSANLNPELSHFDGIIPCGLAEFPVTSLEQLGVSASLADFDEALQRTFPSFLAGIDANNKIS
jgi:lipoyl(octanoyl) transferase